MKPTIIFTNETQFWTETPDCVEKILGVYLIDRNTVFHICSLTGSYEAYFLKNHPVFKPDTSIQDQKDAEAWISKYEDLSEPITYFSEYSTFDAEIDTQYSGPVPTDVDTQREIMNTLVEKYHEGELEYQLPF